MFRGLCLENRNPSYRRFVNIVAFIAVVIVNGLAGATSIIGGRNTAQVSNSFPTLITPAGYVFSIWGIIYILLGVFVVYQALPDQQGKGFQSKIGWLFDLSCVLNIVWLFLWQSEFWNSILELKCCGSASNLELIKPKTIDNTSGHNGSDTRKSEAEHRPGCLCCVNESVANQPA